MSCSPTKVGGAVTAAALSLAGAALIALRVDAARLESRFKPPGSIEPKPSAATVRARHTHRVVEKCALEERPSGLHCRPTLAIGDPRTELRLVPRKLRSLEHRDDQREPVAIVIGGGGSEGTASVKVAPGSWEIEWPGYSPQKTMSLASGSEVAVTLETTSGRCEQISRVCKLVAGAVSKRVDVVGR